MTSSGLPIRHSRHVPRGPELRGPPRLIAATQQINNNNHHHHWLGSATWALAFHRSFCQLKYPAIASSDFVTRVFSMVGLSATRQPPAILEGR
jgi:hypothetical protein